jgi:hypothetical protein
VEKHAASGLGWVAAALACAAAWCLVELETRLAFVRAAIVRRDDVALRAAERDLIRLARRWPGCRGLLRLTASREKQFGARVSLEFVVLASEADSIARETVRRMRATADPCERMRLAFILQRADGSADLGFLRRVAREEPDPMIRKYAARAARMPARVDRNVRIGGGRRD